MKKSLYVLYPLVMLAMAVATFVEKDKGTQYVSDHIYGSWWFIALWALLTAVGVAWIVRQRMKRPSLVLLHMAFVVILLGAAITHFTRWQGYVSLRECGTTNEVVVVDGRHEGSTLRLPFTLRLDTFSVMNHEGTDAAYDYVSALTATDKSGDTHFKISMNETATVHHITILQSSYGGTGLDARTTFLFSYDPWGTVVTYIGYAMLLVAMLLMLCDPKGGFRKLLRSPLLRGASLALLLLLSANQAMASSDQPPTLPKEEAHELGKLLMLYNGRICPMETYAIDFTRKIYGKSSYKGLNAEQVLAGWMLWPDEWCAEPFVKVGGTLASTLMIGSHASVNTFFNDTMGGYILGPYVEECYSKDADKFHRDVAAVDERLQLIMNLRHGSSLKIFPVKKGAARWLAPTDKWPINEQQGYGLFAQHLQMMLRLDAQSGDWDAFNELTGKVRKLQLRDGGASLPSSMQIQAEHLYNKVPFNTILFIVNLTMGFLLLIMNLRRIGRVQPDDVAPKHQQMLKWAPIGIMVLSFLTLTFFSSLRWIIRGTVPMANGFETMLFVAWIVMLLSLFTVHRMRIVLAFGFIMSGFFLLVSHISQMDPQITPIMPVLNSTWLTFHVSVIMFSFAMLSLTFICGITALIIRVKAPSTDPRKEARPAALQTSLHPTENIDGRLALAALSRFFLYPAIAALAIGIFLGAVWAGQSWGQYWSWDPKETWALITMMVYAVPLHTGTVEKLRRPMAYHIYMVLAFLAILMTYFGVNFFLGGLHSYA